MNIIIVFVVIQVIIVIVLKQLKVTNQRSIFRNALTQTQGLAL